MRLTEVPRAKSDKGGGGGEGGGDKGGGLGTGHDRAGRHIEGLEVKTRTGGVICIVTGGRQAARDD